MKKVSFTVITSLVLTSSVIAGSKITQQEYINLWKETAIQQMNIHKIPASITLAQGILESGYGNSDLAQIANNHFGIKCHGWQGETFYKDDDQVNECFRKYSKAEQSYEDHSLFLTSKTRYAGLFSYDIKDYKSWAKGLKDAGYATNPKYPQLLIDLIEKLHLDEFDKVSLASSNEEQTKKNTSALLTSNTHQVQNHKNNLKYIVAKKGDTYYRISKEFGIELWQLYRYNEFGERKDYLVEGDIIYLEAKKRKAKNEKTIDISEDMTIREIAQKEGLKVQQLMKKNNITTPNTIISKGNKLAVK